MSKQKLEGKTKNIYDVLSFVTRELSVFKYFIYDQELTESPFFGHCKKTPDRTLQSCSFEVEYLYDGYED